MRMEDLSFSRLTPACVEEVRNLCTDCFPLNYPDSWFSYVTSDRVYSMGAFSPDGKLVGMVVAVVQPIQQIEGEVGPLLDSVNMDTTAMYILSLGVFSEFRHCGIGSHLINFVLSHVSQLKNCHLVYLHVLASNNSAIEFYKKLGFSEVCQISDYYHIQNRPAAGIVYCYYSNGGQPFKSSFYSYLRRYVCEGSLCNWTTTFCRQVVKWMQALFVKQSTF